MAGRLFAVILLAAVYLLALASVDPVDVAMALAFSAAVVIAFRRFLLSGPGIGAWETVRRTAAFVPFALAVVWEITIGTWRVALVVVGLRPLVSPGIVAVPIGDRSPTGVAATAVAITLSPGEVFVDVDWSRRVMLIHVLDAADPDAVRAHYERFYDRFQRAVLP